jgi:hypothetical protein
MSQVAPPRQEANSRVFWAQLLAGPVLWSIHFLVSYLLVEAICTAGWNFNILGFPGLSVLVLVFTALALIVTVSFAFKSYRLWRGVTQDRSLRDQFRETSSWSEGPLEFGYLSGLLLSALFGLTILAVGVPALFLHPC